MSDDPERPNLKDLLQSLDEDVPAEDRRRVAAAAQFIDSFRSSLHRALEQLAQTKSLQVSWGNGPDSFEMDPPKGLCRYALTIPGVIPTSLPEWIVELVGDSEVVVTEDGKQVWRGSNPADSELLRAVFATMIQYFKEPSK